MPLTEDGVTKNTQVEPSRDDDANKNPATMETQDVDEVKQKSKKRKVRHPKTCMTQQTEEPQP